MNKKEHEDVKSIFIIILYIIYSSPFHYFITYTSQYSHYKTPQNQAFCRLAFTTSLPPKSINRRRPQFCFHMLMHPRDLPTGAASAPGRTTVHFGFRKLGLLLSLAHRTPTPSLLSASYLQYYFSLQTYVK